MKKKKTTIQFNSPLKNNLTNTSSHTINITINIIINIIINITISHIPKITIKYNPKIVNKINLIIKINGNLKGKKYRIDKSKYTINNYINSNDMYR